MASDPSWSYTVKLPPELKKQYLRLLAANEIPKAWLQTQSREAIEKLLSNKYDAYIRRTNKAYYDKKALTKDTPAINLIDSSKGELSVKPAEAGTTFSEGGATHG